MNCDECEAPSTMASRAWSQGPLCPKAIVYHAEEWSNLDPNPVTSRYVQELIAQVKQNAECASQELRSYFPISSDGRITNDPNASQHKKPKKSHPRIGFGTAGLRGHMQPGPMGMNDLVVIQTAQGLARHILRRRDSASNGGDQPMLRAVVGYDHRSQSKFELSSKQFAMYTKIVFEHAGIPCTLLDGFVATPILAFAVTHINAAVGIMVTASHNPKMDNGYKVYWNDGCQIRPPIDEEIAASINEKESLVPWIDYGETLHEWQHKANHSELECYGMSDPEETKKIEAAYFQSISQSGLVFGISNATIKDENSTRPPPPRIAYTAMHGVGYPYAQRSFQTFGLPPFFAVPSQRDPDPIFPTVPFPNPEEKGALDQAMAVARESKCDIVLANDPDADRLGVAEFGRESKEWTVFTGDQIGTLLGNWLWETIGKNSDKPVAMCASTVSSKMLSAMGQREGFHFDETLTGFKWIGSRALSLQSRGYRVLLGYEEAIGFSCGGIIPDKDGISAMGVIATMAHVVYSRGESLLSHLQGLHNKYGEFVCNNGYYRCDDPAIVQQIMNEMRNGGKYFQMVGSYKVESVRDLGSPGFDSTTEDKKPALPTSSSSPMITFRFANQCVAQFRASGTEPKFKYYIELRGKPGEKKEDVKRRLMEMSRVILEELLHPTKNGLIIPSSL